MDRLKYYCKAFGFQGGTIHQISEITGCTVDQLLYATPSNTYTGEWFNRGLYWDTNSKEHKEEVLIPQCKGNIDYWLGVIRGVELKENN